jgi:sulfite reductase alpha subunit-like flavoprotein
MLQQQLLLLQGDPPDNMRRFWKLLLRKSLPPSILAGTAYAVFGLGDSGYVKYNVRVLCVLRVIILWGRGGMGPAEDDSRIVLHTTTAAAAAYKVAATQQRQRQQQMCT